MKEKKVSVSDIRKMLSKLKRDATMRAREMRENAEDSSEYEAANAFLEGAELVIDEFDGILDMY